MGLIEKMRQICQELFQAKNNNVHQFEMACITDTGNVRSHNEDNFYFNQYFLPEEHQSLEQILRYSGNTRDSTIVGVFDGMGGETGGELASYVAASSLKKEGIEKFDGWSEEQWVELFRKLNMHVLELKEEKKISQMGTTATLFAIDESVYWITNIGDSPAYLLREGRFTLITKPHTNEELLKQMGMWERKPGLTQYLGIPRTEFEIMPYIYAESLKPGDIFLLCSDGLTDMLEEEEIRHILMKEQNIDKTIMELEKCALEKGGEDNLTIILCKIF